MSDDKLPDLYIVSALIHAIRGVHTQGESDGRRAVTLNPNSAYALAGLAIVLLQSRQPQ